MEKKLRPQLPHHRSRKEVYPELEPSAPDKFLQSAQEFLADAYTGRDVTRPRELYTFLSLERVPTNLRSRDRQRLKSRSVNTDARRVTFGLEDVIRRRNSTDGIPDSYFRFDIDHLGPEPLPPISRDVSRPVSKEAWPPGSKPVTPFQHIVAEELADEILQSIPISLIKGYHKVNLSTTYIFAPTERLDETLKYNKKVVLPKIKTSDSERDEVVPPSVLTLDSVNNVESIHDKKFQVVNVLSPRKKANMDQPNHLFGVRPECVFINSQLGEKNPLLRNSSKADSNVPRVMPGLHDLKDFAGYPKEYWKLRSEKISQPADLEADMIDRDLYRLRQLSALKLNSIERTFPIKNDPFRKWRGKGGEPLFSPGQQRLPPKRRRHRFGITSLSETVNRTQYYPQNRNPPLAVTITPLKISAGDAIQEEDEEEQEEDQTHLRAPFKNNMPYVRGEAGPVSNNRSIHLADLAEADTTLTSIMANGSDHRPLETNGHAINNTIDQEKGNEEKEVVSGLGKVTVQRQFEMKKRREQNKQMLKTSVVSFELDSQAALNTARRSQMLTARLLGLSNQPSPNAAPILSDQRPGVIEVPRDDVDADINDDKSHRQNSESQPSSGKQTPRSTQKQVARVMSLNFNPPPDFTTPPSYPDAVYPMAGGSYGQNQQLKNEFPAQWTDINSHHRIAHPTPATLTAESRVESLAGAGGEGNMNYGSSRLRALHLEVFGERNEEGGNIAVSNGRTSFHPEMPAYRLDLQNYPPLNPRQTCRDLTTRRSRSATSTDRARVAGLLTGTFPPDLKGQANQQPVTKGDYPTCCSRHGTRQAPNSAGRSDRLIGLLQSPGAAHGSSVPRRRSGSAGPAVEIRFGQQGEVILSSSREKRGHQSSR
ncbi:hypothetical protein ElyMa_004250200 [Elysia marginata]|uniref:Uncharacterized protein n=1 Tax=Elysia marginata TaxID=1093978 RepID=A0AAV4GRD6_9GAST|nr:hypothetical protein ElyMa_004250200 [Elysia marginata]